MASADPKKVAKCVKEGGKKGIELSGCADMGGLEFFTTQMEAAEGDIDLLQICMDAANKEIDPNEEESKGGSGAVGKMLLSAGENQLSLINYVPKDKLEKCNAEEWMKATLVEVGGGEIILSSPETCKAVVKADATQNRYVLKDKDACQSMSVNWLKSKGLFPQAEEEDDWVPDEDAGVEW